MRGLNPEPSEHQADALSRPKQGLLEERGLFLRSNLFPSKHCPNL